MTNVNPNSQSYPAAVQALATLDTLINDLNVALAAGGNVSAALVAAQGSRSALVVAMGAAAPWGVLAGATNQANFDTDGGKVVAPTILQQAGSVAITQFYEYSLGSPYPVMAGNSAANE